MQNLERSLCRSLCLCVYLHLTHFRNTLLMSPQGSRERTCKRLANCSSHCWGLPEHAPHPPPGSDRHRSRVWGPTSLEAKLIKELILLPECTSLLAPLAAQTVRPVFHYLCISISLMKNASSRESGQDRISPGWCGPVDGVPACKLKSCWFDSQSGHMPGLWARSPVGGVWEATNQ